LGYVSAIIPCDSGIVRQCGNFSIFILFTLELLLLLQVM